MTRPVHYRIIDRPDGRYDVTATLASSRTFTHEGLATFAEVSTSISLLRDIMAAYGAEVLLDPALAKIATESID